MRLAGLALQLAQRRDGRFDAGADLDHGAEAGRARGLADARMRGERDRRRGETYFPEYALRDLSVGLGLLVLLMMISALFGAPLDERADPASTDYVPRPEWYFFFIFQLLKYFSGDMEVIGEAGNGREACVMKVEAKTVDPGSLQGSKVTRRDMWW